ncbi:suppressor of fused protein SUFU [Dietzia kunjamensis]|uniref:suppressor of fused domain protein n=1 Tax=Dietzia kunjamensis TaxID=322509 RepID=UPI000E72A4F7|nr:suppressor of fused domain protein [Dietzia kunjamensis]MBB1011656.1 suppressor of fused domain protein [Dietzia kunjamensis]RKE59674.1 suppressor of fused protein SUFU [Dietzia kunjamensis]
MSNENNLPGPETADLSGLEGILGHKESVRVLRYPHETEPDEEGQTTEWHCDIVVVDDVPAPGFSTYATVGARELPTNVTTPEGRQIRSEFVTVGRTGHRAMADVLDACALAVATGSIHVAPGAVIPNAVGLVDPGRKCEHLVLTPPFLWPDLQVVDETGGADGSGPLLTRLQAVPITTAEMSAIGRDGADALFERLDTADADVTNPDRPSVV